MTNEMETNTDMMGSNDADEILTSRESIDALRENYEVRI